MQFLKNHYEKVVLSIVLLGLALAAAALPIQVSRVRDKLEETSRALTVKVRAKPFKPLDDWLKTNKTVVARLDAPLNLQLSGPHNLFNPVTWKKMPDGRVVPIRTGSEIGPGAVKVVQIRELSLTVSYDAVEASDPPQYKVTVRKETSASPRPDTRTVSQATPRNTLFELVNVEGTTNDPTALVIKLKDFVEPITVEKEKPFTRTIGYAADLVYDAATGKQQKWLNRRVSDTIKIDDDPENYKIVAIQRDEVVLENAAKKRYILKLSTTATASTR